jgi:hypothetical protein
LAKLETILTSCIDEIKSGKATLNECLERYPVQRRKLEPLLKLALSIQRPTALHLDNEFKQSSKAQILRQIRSMGQKKKTTFSNIFSLGLPQRYAWARIPISILIAVILLSSLTAGTAYASQSSLPGEFLYPVKTTTEDVRLFLAGSPAVKAELNLEFAKVRLEEISRLSSQNEENTIVAFEGYQGNLQSARQQIGRITNNSVLLPFLENAIDTVQIQVEFCDIVIDSGPTFIGVVEEADTFAVNEQVNLIGMLAQQNNLRAAQINLNAMQNRLQRAQNKANSKQYQLMIEALLQYQQFIYLGEEILDNSQTTNQSAQIEELLSALPGYINTLNSIYQEVPREYSNEVEVCQQTTLQFQTQARHRYQRQGNPETTPEGSNQLNDSNSISEQEIQDPYHGGTKNLNIGMPSTTPSGGSGENSRSGSSNGQKYMGDGPDNGMNGPFPSEKQSGSSTGLT